MEISNLLTQQCIGQHIRAGINVINPVQFVQGNRVTKKMVGLECGIDAKNAFTPFRPLNVVKKDGVREPFDHEKIKVGLRKACWKRPVSDEQLEGIITAVENDVYANYENEINSRDLGNLVMQKLRDVDQVAYVRFASVYREFKDVRDFVQELQPILAESKRPK